jgi:2-hydroxychromene-2-carboxylate isomerase
MNLERVQREMTSAPITFYFDLGSPYAYLAAERLHTVLPEPVEWQPVLLGGLFKMNGRSSWALGDYERRQRGMAEIERRAYGYGLPPLRWPDPWPSAYLDAMRATTYAFDVGRGREFTMQGFRDAFQKGHELGITAHVLDVGAATGLDRNELQQAITNPEIKQRLRDATDKAHARGVFGVPTIAIGDELFWGDDRLEAAADELRKAGPQPVRPSPMQGETRGG